MNSEIYSTSVQTRRGSANASAAITADFRMHPQDQRNSRDVAHSGPGRPEGSRPAAGTAPAETGSPGSGPLAA